MSAVDVGGGNAVERLRRERVVAIARRVPPADLDALVAALAAGGIGVIEITLDSDDAMDAIRRLRNRGGMTVAAGTVRTARDAERAIEAGAEICVAPAFVVAMVERCRELDVPAIPGALTPSEIEAAVAAGAAMVKLFPAALGGPRYVRDVLAPLADVPLLATGGVTAADAIDYIRAGAAAVGLGSALIEGGPAAVEARARALVSALRGGHTPPP